MTWLIGAVCLTGTVLLTRHHRTGWLFGTAGQLLWVWYGAVMTGTVWNGISAASLVYTAVNVHGWGRWSSAPAPTPDARPGIEPVPRRGSVRV